MWRFFILRNFIFFGNKKKKKKSLSALSISREFLSHHAYDKLSLHACWSAFKIWNWDKILVRHQLKEKSLKEYINYDIKNWWTTIRSFSHIICLSACMGRFQWRWIYFYRGKHLGFWKVKTTTYIVVKIYCEVVVISSYVIWLDHACICSIFEARARETTVYHLKTLATNIYSIFNQKLNIRIFKGLFVYSL
jgi:tRNA(Phe) wybutosine-synthesizing methylase Tyw3